MHEPDFDYDEIETDECSECAGAEGYNSCMEDCCPMIGGEEACIDRRCWRRCECCGGDGFVRIGDA